MTTEDFKAKYYTALELERKNWKFIPLGGRKGFMASISGLGEVEKDFLYYEYANKIWEIDLNQLIENTNTTLKSLVKSILKNKVSTTPTIEFIELKHRKNDQVAVDLNTYGRLTSAKPAILEGTQQKSAPSIIEAPIAQVLDGLDRLALIRNRTKTDLILDDISGKILELNSTRTIKKGDIDVLIGLLQYLKQTI